MKTLNPFGVNALAVAAASEAINDRAHLARVVEQSTTERERVATALSARGYSCAPSQANFVFFDTGTSGAAFAERLRHKGVLIKGWQEVPFENWAHVTVGTPVENDVFLSAL